MRYGIPRTIIVYPQVAVDGKVQDGTGKQLTATVNPEDRRTRLLRGELEFSGVAMTFDVLDSDAAKAVTGKDIIALGDKRYAIADIAYMTSRNRIRFTAQEVK